ncbi:hypothetical protein DRO53_04910 [Candidatus Bathyarchaeota archaeon]|nr:MAG: hypothetical protein DRO53_04910 [Candidatus Bathyarchaeota archaeon]
MRVEELLAKILSKPSSPVEALMDRGAASLGDSYLNFAFSLAQSLEGGRPKGLRLDNRLLAEAVRKAGLRGKLPKRLSRRDIGGAAEALLAYAAAGGLLSTESLVERLRVKDRGKLVEALACLLKEAYRWLENAEG